MPDNPVSLFARSGELQKRCSLRLLTPRWTKSSKFIYREQGDTNARFKTVALQTSLDDRMKMPAGESLNKSEGKPIEKYKLAQSEILGRYFVAAKDLIPGEVILRETVYAVGPGAFNKNYMCFACLRLLSDFKASKNLYCCTSCNVAIFCGSNCQEKKSHHTEFECEAFRRNKNLSNPDNLPTVMQILLPLRVWLLQKGDRKAWNRVLEMEAHIEERRDTPIWRNREVNVIQILRNFDLVPEEKENEPELLQRLCSILDVNSFELRPPGGIEDCPLRGLYPNTAVMAHECIRNTHITVDDKFQITVYASLPIKSGDPILVNYTSPLLAYIFENRYCSLFSTEDNSKFSMNAHLINDKSNMYANFLMENNILMNRMILSKGSEERRDHLRTGKYFECVCSRCSDPRELGSNLSTLACPRCKNGLVINKNPLRSDVYNDKDSWQCEKCERLFSGRLVKTTLVITKSLIGRTELNMKSLEELLEKLTRSYHRNHFFVVSVKQKLLEIYKKECACLNPEVTFMKRMVDICRDLIDVLEIVEPGISRSKGVLLWEMHLPLVLLADRDYSVKKIEAKKLVERLEEAENHLKRSLTMLLLEPPETPEGFLARQALQDYKSLRKTLAQARQLETSIILRKRIK